MKKKFLYRFLFFGQKLKKQWEIARLYLSYSGLNLLCVSTIISWAYRQLKMFQEIEWHHYSDCTVKFALKIKSLVFMYRKSVFTPKPTQNFFSCNFCATQIPSYHNWYHFFTFRTTGTNKLKRNQGQCAQEISIII
jgi:hypothetical protein